MPLSGSPALLGLPCAHVFSARSVLSLSLLMVVAGVDLEGVVAGDALSVVTSKVNCVSSNRLELRETLAFNVLWVLEGIAMILVAYIQRGGGL